MTPAERADLADLERELLELEARERGAKAWQRYRNAVDGIHNVVRLTPQERADMESMLKETLA